MTNIPYGPHPSELHSVLEAPPYKVGDKEYTGYLVLTNGYWAIADYTKDTYDLTYIFHVDGEYDPCVSHWMCLPTKPVVVEKRGV